MYNNFIKPIIDLVFAVILLIITAPLWIFLSLLVKLSSSGSILFVSDRVGKNNKIFKMYKFRTMKEDTPQLATHLMTSPEDHLIPIGSFLRKTSLDELPQLLNIIKGDMSFVGPRPALFNQDDLISLRTEKGVHELIPGITGWAQIHGRDEISIPAKVQLDEFYLNKRNILLDLKIILYTGINVLRRKDVSH